MNLTEATEIRKLAPTYALELARLLQDNWKTFMSIIPENLEKQHYKCKINDNNRKYNSDHIRIIEGASQRANRLPSDILFEEWGSSGRIRPTLGHLFFLLQECRLYGAADYVARILGRNPPQRPSDGPAARIELTPTERNQIENSDNIINALEDMTYPSLLTDQHSVSQNNINADAHYVPSITINEHQENSYLINESQDNLSINYSLNIDSTKFSSNQIPAISELLNCDDESIQNNSIQQVIPPLSILLNNSNLSLQQNSNLPNLSILNNSSTPSTKFTSNPNLPDFDALQGPSSTASHNISVPRTLGSPLPSLLLNTLLKHYTYAELDIATNHFNENPYDNLKGPNCDGRFLGSGAFGSVYLAYGLLNQPVAVKKINLKDLNIVRADDFVTKQFTNEVEILYKYKHDNLLSIIGYSCDGLTYCLLYEYVPGGNLKDRLQETARILSWKERFNIAVGTANAVAYLHTAYSTPLIHRDIKSANILLDNNNQPKLSDFGIIRLSSSSTTGTNQILGTSAYMAPEAHRGDVSVKMDTYSFGVVLLELLTSLPPIDYNRNGNDIVTYVQDILADDETNLTSLLDRKAGSWWENNIDYATELYKISFKCLQEKKNTRPTMTNIKDVLKILLEGGSTEMS
ncbi:putative tube death domain protein [Trypoxylus dichotomus]